MNYYCKKRGAPASYNTDAPLLILIKDLAYGHYSSFAAMKSAALR